MKKLSYYQEVIENYINGNLSDFRKQVNNLTKKELLTLCDMMREYYKLDGNMITFKYID